MRLTRVTISGADDAAAHQALYDLSAEYPFVEWGILCSSSRRGQSRYPSDGWIDTLGEHDRQVHIAMHLCGAMARSALGGSIFECEAFMPRRIQLNGFSDYVLPELLIARRHTQVEFILQCGTLEAVSRAEAFRGKYPNVSALWDKSGGTGAALDAWALPMGALHIGYAGGIDEHNIVEYLTKLTSNREPHDFWIDLESGARTDDAFDLPKVRRILELARAFVGTP